MRPKIFSLENGFKMVLQKETKADLICLDLKGLSGSLHEKPSQIGCAHLAEHLIGNKLQRNLGEDISLVGITSREDVSFKLKVEKENLWRALSEISQIFEEINFSQEELTLAKKTTLQEVNRIKDHPEKLIGRISKKVLYPNTRMEIINLGETGHIEALNLKNIRDFLKENYHPNNFVLSLIGNFKKEDFKKIPEYFKNFIEIQKQNELSPYKTWEGIKVNIVKFPNIKQEHLRIDYYAPLIGDPKRYAFEILSKIYAERVAQKLKTELGIAYQIAGVGFYGSSHGNFGIYTAVEKGKIQETLKIIRETKEELKKQLNQDLWEKAKKLVIRERSHDLEKNSHRNEFYTHMLLHAKKLVTVEEENRNYQDTSFEKGQEMWNLLRNEGITIVSPLKQKGVKVYLEKIF